MSYKIFKGNYVISKNDKEYDFYTYTKFPSGELNIQILPMINTLDLCYNFILKSKLLRTDNKWLEELLLIVSYLKSLTGLNKLPALSIPYMPYSRADRNIINKDGTLSLDNFSTIINIMSMNFDNIITYNLHTNRHDYLLKDGIIVNYKEDIINKINMFIIEERFKGNKIGLICPDKGSVNRLKEFSNQIDQYNFKIHIDKKRENGSLSMVITDIDPKLKDIEYITKLKEDHASVSFLIVDDICDGGATFLNVAELVRRELMYLDREVKINIELYVTHGIFSKGMEELEKEIIIEHPDGVLVKRQLIDKVSCLYNFLEEGKDV